MELRHNICWQRRNTRLLRPAASFQPSMGLLSSSALQVHLVADRGGVAVHLRDKIARLDLASGAAVLEVLRGGC